MASPPQKRRPGTGASLEKIADHLLVIAGAYSYRLRERGPSAGGVFWKNADGQILRYDVLLGILDARDDQGGVSINDLGCGYGVLFDLIKDQHFMREGRFYGYDICPDMVEEARRLHPDPRAHFSIAATPTREADYSFVSGTYNMCIEAERGAWSDYIFESLAMLWNKSRRGIAFNMLDARTRVHIDDLYYADRADFLDFAYTLSDNVTIIDDYPLDEWTIFVRKS